jgi:diguanylate cyclase
MVSLYFQHQVHTARSAQELMSVMSDFILARVSETLHKDQSLESLVRQLLEMLEMVTEMESTYLTKIDDDGGFQHIQYARNSKQLDLPEGFSLPWGDSLCKRAG